MPIPSRAHDYGLNDMVSLFNDALYGNGGILPNLSFMPPRDQSSYDNIAWTARISQQELFRQFIGQTVGQTANRRAAALSSALGIGNAGMAVFNGAMRLDPRLAMSVIGHHGGAEAVKNILGMGNSMAYARGAQMGGVLDPTTLVQNTNFAAIQGGMAYANNFNLDGSINAAQTSGLNLQQVGYVIGRTLSDRTSYSTWANRIRRGEGLTASERTLTENDIRAFTNGEKMDPKKFEAASNSFNEDVKKMTKELNGLIASVSKMTGSCDEAIRFLDNYTNGNMTSATESAKRARSRAAKLAANVRVAAADAGVSPEELYAMSVRYQNFSGGQLLNDPRMIALGAHKKLFGDTSNLGMLAFADWKKAHPYASQEQLDRAAQTIGMEVKDFNNSGIAKLNTLVAQAKVLRPDLDTSEYDKLLQRGDGAGAQRWVMKTLGERTYRQIYDDDKLMRILVDPRVRNAKAELDKTAFTQGKAREEQRKGQFGLFLDTVDAFVNSQDEKTREKIGMIGSDVIRGQLMSDEVLSAAGIKRSEFTKFREQHKGYDWSQLTKELFTAAGENGKSGDRLLDLIKKGTVEKIASYLPENEARNLRNEVAWQQGGEITEDDLRQARDQLAREYEQDDIDRTKAAAVDGSRDAMDSLLKKGGSKFTRSVLGKMNVSIAEQLAKVGGKTSPEKLQLSEKELNEVNKKALAELENPENTKTFEEVTRGILRAKYSDKLLESEDLLESMDLIGADGNLSEKALSTFGDTFTKAFNSGVLGYEDFGDKKPQKKYRDKVTEEEAYQKALRNKAKDNPDAVRLARAYSGKTAGDVWVNYESEDYVDHFKAAGEMMGDTGRSALAKSVQKRTDAEAAADATSMLFTESGRRGFKQLSEDVSKRTELADDIESEFNKKDKKWQTDLKKAVSAGDEEALNKMFGDNESFKNMKDLGMSALQAGKLISAGLDTTDKAKKDIARQDAVLEQKMSAESANVEIAQILRKILTLLQGAVK